jgi:hypothetical protein
MPVFCRNRSPKVFSSGPSKATAAGGRPVATLIKNPRRGFIMNFICTHVSRLATYGANPQDQRRVSNKLARVLRFNS